MEIRFGSTVVVVRVLDWWGACALRYSSYVISVCSACSLSRFSLREDHRTGANGVGTMLTSKRVSRTS